MSETPRSESELCESVTYYCLSFCKGKKNPIVLFQRLIKMCKCQNWKKQLLLSVWLLQWEHWQCVKRCKQKQKQIVWISKGGCNSSKTNCLKEQMKFIKPHGGTGLSGRTKADQVRRKTRAGRNLLLVTQTPAAAWGALRASGAQGLQQGAEHGSCGWPAPFSQALSSSLCLHCCKWKWAVLEITAG